MTRFRHTQSQKQLINAFREGNEYAFESLFRRYNERLFYFLYGLLKSKEDAEEIVQETFLKLWERRELFREEYSFESLIFRIARNSFIDHNRKKVSRAVFEKHFRFIADLAENTTDEYVLFQETRFILDSVMNGLPPKRKEIFLLQKVEGLSRKEIAEKLGISVITVDSQLLKANKFMKEELKKYGLAVVVLLFFINVVSSSNG